ncbi:tyrosine-type recombinase/integrase [Dyadobacter frigoris]|uniref:DUF4102 domain-containing protein n=1 Tax=Dyadobacter frigoris TaxID=2576211 RepID=A0A4U6D9J6_9BACT|nr:site-specific integrase [Dyadobacter frigoris]TKT93325.1 DUF4102 domain-containing protein [Dyadobacter frigoris]
MSKKINFTKSVIENATSPKNTRLVLHDTKIVGLQCRVGSTGVKTFCVFKRIRGGAPERITLGRFPDLTIENARRMALIISSEIASGANPAQVKRAHKAEMTFKELFEDYLEKHAKFKSRTWEKDLGRFKYYLEKPLGKKRHSQITKSDIAAIHNGISREPVRGKKCIDGKPKLKSGSTANRILDLISAVFGWGIQSDLCQHNPAKGIKRNPTRSRERFLQKDELPAFFKSLGEETNLSVRDYVLISLLTGARQANVLAMRWDEISFERKEWRIPRTKNGDPQTVVLVDEVIKILKARKGHASRYVFPSKSKSGHLSDAKKGWARIIKRAHIVDLRMHDLRRTLGSWQARTGASLIIIGKSLNHKSLTATQVYARLDSDPVRESVQKATSAILEAAQLDLFNE